MAEAEAEAEAEAGDALIRIASSSTHRSAGGGGEQPDDLVQAADLAQGGTTRQLDELTRMLLGAAAWGKGGNVCVWGGNQAREGTDGGE